MAKDNLDNLHKRVDALTKEYQGYINSIDAFIARVNNRIMFLAKTYPDAVISKMHDTEIKAGGSLTNLGYVQHLSMETKLEYIRSIEDWLDAQNPMKQGKLF